MNEDFPYRAPESHRFSFFETVDSLPADPILNIPILFQKDARVKKVNLGIGNYRDADGKPFILNEVREAEELILKKNLDKEYLPIEGDREYIQTSLKLVFGQESPCLKNGCLFAAQSIGGTGALRLGFELLNKQVSRKGYISSPSWNNHLAILSRAGMEVDVYPYYDRKEHRIDFKKMVQSLKGMPKKSIVLLHASCHNPTGADLSEAEWRELSNVILEAELFPFFDLAYQGLGDDLEQDAFAVRYFAEQGHEMCVASSNAKNFGLYGERAGLLTILTKNAEQAEKIGTHIRQIIRGSYSTPPLHGVRIISWILNSEQLKTSWKNELKNMRDRITEMRECLMFGLQTKIPHADFGFLKNQKGLFSTLGLDSPQVDRLRQEFGIYLVEGGRVNIAGLNMHNIDYVVDSFAHVIRK